MHMSHVTTEYPCTSRIQIRNYQRRNDKKIAQLQQWLSPVQ